MNPYEVLGVSENADEETIKRAYRDLVKKYHPDNYKDNPLANLANEKLQQVNEAYDIITKQRQNGSSYGGGSSNQYSGSSNSQYAYIRNLIQQRKLAEADAELNRINTQNAEWHYLKGCVCIGRGWHFDGINHLQAAVNLDPSNMEYRNMLNSVSNRANTFNTTGNNRGYSSSDACSCCGNLLCADCCCEMMGGDLIPCC